MLKKGATDYVLKSNLPKLSHAVQRALNEFNELAEHKKSRRITFRKRKKNTEPYLKRIKIHNCF